MNIPNIQIAQGLFRTVEERLSSRKANISEQSDASTPQVNMPDAEEKTVDTPKVSSEENLMQVVYPPFFPIGNTQDILSIEGVKLEAEKSAAIVARDEQQASQEKEINNKAKTDKLLKGKAPAAEHSVKHEVKHESNRGVVIDFKV